MNKKHIESLLRIEKLGSISKAADYIGVTQPTLSKFLLNTEKHLNTKLFYRYSRTVQPSEEGVIYLRAFKKMLADFKFAEQEILILRNEFAHEFSVGIHPILARKVLPKVENKIQGYEKINFKYSFQDSRSITEDVANGKIDFGIVADPQKYPDIIIKRMRKEHTGLYSIDGHLKDTLHYNSKMIFVNKIISGIDCKRKKQVDDYDTILSLLESGSGMGLLPSLIPKENKLKRIKRVGPEIEICLVYSSVKTKNKAFIKAVSIIQESLAYG